MKLSSITLPITASLLINTSVTANDVTSIMLNDTTIDVPKAVMNTLNANRFTVMLGKGKESDYASGYLSGGNILVTNSHSLPQQKDDIAFMDWHTFREDKNKAKGCRYSTKTKVLIDDVSADFAMIEFPTNSCNPINKEGLTYKINGTFPEVGEELFMECNGSKKAHKGQRHIINMNFDGSAWVGNDEKKRDFKAGMVKINSGIPENGCSGAGIITSDGTIIGAYGGDVPDNITGEFGNFFYTPAQKK